MKETAQCFLKVLGYEFCDWEKFKKLVSDYKFFIASLTDFSVRELSSEAYKEIVKLEKQINSTKNSFFITNWLFRIKIIKDVNDEIEDALRRL